MQPFKRALPILALALGTGAEAHVVLDRDTAPAGSYFKATLRVGHGCNGSPTRRLTVFVPPGVAVAKPQPKPGWTMETRTAALAAPVLVHGKPVAEAVSQVSWSGGPLADGQFDEFTMLVLLPAQPGSLYFRTLQECETGQADWAQRPDAGGARLSHPAPRLQVLPVGAQRHAH